MSNDIINACRPLFSPVNILYSHCLSFVIILIKWSIVFNNCKGCHEHISAPKVHTVQAMGYYFESGFEKVENKILKNIYFVD